MPMPSSFILFLKRALHICIYVYKHTYIYDELFSKTNSFFRLALTTFCLKKLFIYRCSAYGCIHIWMYACIHTFSYYVCIVMDRCIIKVRNSWFRGVTVSTQDSESCDPSSNLGGTWAMTAWWPAVLRDRVIRTSRVRTLVESNLWLKNVYFSLPGQTLGIF